MTNQPFFNYKCTLYENINAGKKKGYNNIVSVQVSFKFRQISDFLQNELKNGIRIWKPIKADLIHVQH